MYSVRYCTKCGTKLVENAKYCTNCGIQVLFAVKINVGGVEQDYQHIKSEEEAANKIIDDLGIDKSLFEYVKPSQEYSTIRYKGIDLFRIKYTDNTKWIQVPMTTQMRKANMDNPLFDIEKNKNKDVIEEKAFIKKVKKETNNKDLKKIEREIEKIELDISKLEKEYRINSQLKRLYIIRKNGELLSYLNKN